jgi:hypothetical protein
VLLDVINVSFLYTRFDKALGKKNLENMKSGGIVPIILMKLCLSTLQERFH